MTPPPAFKLRAGQREFERGVDRFRVAGYVCRRQYGKTTLAGRIALKKMMRTPGHTVVFGSVKLDLGREIVRKEGEAIRQALSQLGAEAAKARLKLEMVEAGGGKSLAGLKADDFAEVYESQRLEFRLWHDSTTYSRTKVVALTTASVGETGDLILDEVGRVKNFREVWEAVSPIIASNPAFRCMLTTTPPPDDAHFSFELLAPPVGFDPAPNPAGNWFRSEFGVNVLRVSAYDAAADGVLLFDDETGAAITPEESRRRAHDKEAWDRNYGCLFVMGGTAAIGFLVLDSAQKRGIGKCAFQLVQDDLDFDAALGALRKNLGGGRVGVGFDVATTESATSNPSAVVVLEESGNEFTAPLSVVWKTKDPEVARQRVKAIVETIADRPVGGRARRVAIDSSNEKFFAADVRRLLAALVPVELVGGGETVEQPGGEKITKKALLGSRLAAAFSDNRISVAPDRYTREDLRRVRNDRGSFDCELGPNGEHGDVFDSHKLALWALTNSGGALANTEGVLFQGADSRGGGSAYVPGFKSRTLKL